MDLQLAGKRALVTGSGSGIGEAVATALVKEGAAVVVHDRREDEAWRVARALQDAGGTVAVALGDLELDEEAQRVAETAMAAFAGIDIVVNNAGATVLDEWSAPEPARWLQLYNQNVVSMTRIIQHLLPPMRERGWGRFIQIASASSSLPGPTMAAYGATKSAIVNLTVSLAEGVAGTGITANAISPGAIMTPLMVAVIQGRAAKKGWQGEWAEIERRYVAEFIPHPSGRIGRVEEVADLVTFVASPRAGYINGANLRVDGGLVPTTN